MKNWPRNDFWATMRMFYLEDRLNEILEMLEPIVGRKLKFNANVARRLNTIRMRIKEYERDRA